MIGAVVLAAGASRRMGGEKVLLPFGRSTMLETILETLAAANVHEIVVVTRPDLPAAIEKARGLGARIVENPHPQDEMLVSVRLGVAKVSAGAAAVFVWPADHPAVRPETIERLARSVDPAAALVPCYRGRRGHPALVGHGLLPAIAAIPAGEGLRHLWRSRPELLREIEVEDPGVILNLDTPEAYRAALEEQGLDPEF